MWTKPLEIRKYGFKNLKNSKMVQQNIILTILKAYYIIYHC